MTRSPYNLRKRSRPEPAPQSVKKETTKRFKKSDDEEKKPLKKVKDVKPPPPPQSPVKKEGRRYIMGFGGDSCGELGQRKIGISRKNPVEVPIPGNVKQIACGPFHTICLTESGEIYSYGCNDEGALGRVTDGDEELEATPTKVAVEDKVIKVTAGDSHSAVLTDDHKVFVWGNFKDEHGSVGLTPECNGKKSLEPIQLLPDIKFKDIASGSDHMLLLNVDGEVYSFGVGEQGQLGRLKPETTEESDGSSSVKVIPLTEESRELFLTPQLVSLKDVDPQRPFVCDAIFAGNFCSFATNTDKKKNRLAAWGLNNFYQLGFKNTKGQIVHHAPKRSTFTCSTSMINVAPGMHHTLFLTRTGRVYAAGRNEYGMLGIDLTAKEVCPAKAVEFPETVNDISAGVSTSFAVTSEGRLFSFGMGGLNLGLQNEDDLKTPTEVTSLKDKKVVNVSAGSSITTVLIEE